MDTGLLAGADADGLSVLDIADRVGLGVFEGNQSDQQVDLCALRQRLIFGNDVVEQLGADLQVVSALLEGDAKHVLVLKLSRNIVRVDFDDVVAAFALLLQDGQRFVGVAWSDDAVGNLALDDAGGAFVADVGQRDEVAVGGHSVRASGSGIGAGDWGKLAQVIDKVDFAQRLVQRQADRGAGRGNVFEGSCCRQAGGLLELLDQLPAVEGVQEIDVARFAVEHLDWQLASVLHKDAGRLLIGVAAIFQRKLICHKRSVLSHSMVTCFC